MPNKLLQKNRWLISRDIVAHLRRAGVDCNIIIPESTAMVQDRVMSRREQASGRASEVRHPLVRALHELRKRKRH